MPARVGRSGTAACAASSAPRGGPLASGEGRLPRSEACGLLLRPVLAWLSLCALPVPSATGSPGAGCGAGGRRGPVGPPASGTTASSGAVALPCRVAPSTAVVTAATWVAPSGCRPGSLAWWPVALGAPSGVPSARGMLRGTCACWAFARAATCWTGACWLSLFCWLAGPAVVVVASGARAVPRPLGWVLAACSHGTRLATLALPLGALLVLLPTASTVTVALSRAPCPAPDGGGDERPTCGLPTALVLRAELACSPVAGTAPAAGAMAAAMTT